MIGRLGALFNRHTQISQSKGFGNDKEGKDTYEERHREAQDRPAEEEEQEEKKVIRLIPIDEINKMINFLNSEKTYFSRGLNFVFKEDEGRIVLKNAEGKAIQALTPGQLSRIFQSIKIDHRPQVGGILNIKG